MTNSSNGEGIYKDLLETLPKNTYPADRVGAITPYNQLPPRPPLKQHKEVAIDPNLLDKLVGRYQFNSDTMLTITREGNRRFVQENDDPRQELGAESDRQFFSKVANDEHSFEFAAAGHVTRMVLPTGGKDLPIKRIN